MAKKKHKNSRTPAANAAAQHAQQSTKTAAKPSLKGKMKTERMQKAKRPKPSDSLTKPTRQKSSEAFASWDGSLTMLHYLFLATIFVSINAFHLSGTIDGPWVTDHLFVKNFYTTVIFMLITISFVGLFFWQSKKLMFPKHILTTILVGFFLYACMGLIWAEYKGFTVTKLTIWWVGFLAYFWAHDTIRRGGLVPLMQVLFFSGVGVAAIGLWQVYFEPSPTAYNEMKANGLSPTRLVDMAAGPSSTFGNRNMANHLIVLTAPLSIYLIGTKATQGWKWTYFVGLAMLLLFSFHTQTRSAYIALSIEIFLIALFILPRTFRPVAYLGSLLLALLALYLLDFSTLGWFMFAILGSFFTLLFLWRKIPSSPLYWRSSYTLISIVVFGFTLALANYSYVDGTVVPFWDVLLGRVEATSTGLAAGVVYDDFGNSAANLRIQIWRDAWEIFKSTPIVGVGLGSFYAIFHFSAFDVAVDSAIRYPHNEYFTILAELGVIGLVFFVSLVVAALYTVISAYRRLIRSTDVDRQKEGLLLLICVVAGALGTMVNATFSFPYEYVSPYIVVSCFFAILIYVKQTLAVDLNETAIAAEPIRQTRHHTLRGWRGGALTLLIVALCVTSLSLNMYWNKRISQANASMKMGQWIPISFNDSDWLTHANYFWTVPAYLSVFKGQGDCDAVDAIADSILSVAPSYYDAKFEKLSCGVVVNIERTLTLLSEADLVSTYLKDNAWNNLLRLSIDNKKPYFVKDHLLKMEAAYLTRPEGVRHRYANSLGRRFYEFALKLSDEARDLNLRKAVEYLSLATEQKPINTKYKADLVNAYIAQNDLAKARSLTVTIETQNPESKLVGGLKAKLGIK